MKFDLFEVYFKCKISIITNMTEYNYQASGKFHPSDSFLTDKWNVTATYTDGSSSFNVASGVPTLSHMDSGLVNYLSFKHQTTSVFSKGQTFSTTFSVIGSDGTVLASPSVTYQNFGYTVTDGDWSNKGGYFGTLVKKLLAEKYSQNDTNFICDLGSFQVTTWMYQPHGVTNSSVTVVTKNDNKQQSVAKPVTVVAEPEDVFAGGGVSDIFGTGAKTGDY